MRAHFSVSESLKRRNRTRPKGKRYEPSKTERGVTMTDENLTFIPAGTHIRPLRDRMVVEPLDTVHSRFIIVPPGGDPVRGVVKAIGPGLYRKQYDSREKHKRTKVWEGMQFVPTTVKVGETVLLDPHLKYEQFFWGDILHIHAREEDVAGIEQ
jgi:co-chaperonin GroES (HSP10)